MNTKQKNEIFRWTADQVMKGHTTALIAAVQKRFKISRPTASKLVQEMIEQQLLTKSGPHNRPVYDLGQQRRILRSYRIEETADEQTIWARDFAPFLSLTDNVKNIAHHAFTEMMNNAHDHSGGKNVYAYVRVSEERLIILIHDDGIGIFKKISDALHLPDRRLALLELSKGKFTTDPERHSGEGIFFTSRMFDLFAITANDLEYMHSDNGDEDILTDEVIQKMKTGTSVGMLIRLDSQRTTRKVFEQFTLDHPDDLSFNKTVVPVKLARMEGENLISRSQAKRLVARFDGFKKVILDFDEVEEIGQAFADEVFRVFVNSHPNVMLETTNTSDYVRRMIDRVKGNNPT